MLLEWQSGGQKHSQRLPDQGRVTIGRSTGNTIVIPDATVSRQHAQIDQQGTISYLRNLSHTNPIYLDTGGQRLRLGAGDVAPLQPGATIVLGQIVITCASPPLTLRIRCPGPCGRVIEVPPSGFCPYCGTALATADTYTG